MENVTSRHEEDIHHRRSHLPVILGTIALLAAGDIYFLSQNSKLAARLGQLEGSMRADFSQMEENWQSSAGATQKTLEALRAQLADERGQALRNDGFQFLGAQERPHHGRSRPLGIARKGQGLLFAHIQRPSCVRRLNAFLLKQS